MRLVFLAILLAACSQPQGLQSQRPALDDAPHVAQCGESLEDVLQSCTFDEVDTEWEKVVGLKADQPSEEAARAERMKHCDAGQGLLVGDLAAYVDGDQVEWLAAKHPTWCVTIDGTPHCIMSVQRADEARLASIGCVNNWKQGEYHSLFMRGRFRNRIVTSGTLYNGQEILMLESIPPDWSPVQ